MMLPLTDDPARYLDVLFPVPAVTFPDNLACHIIQKAHSVSWCRVLCQHKKGGHPAYDQLTLRGRPM
jgi:hypothetical protein